MKLIQKLILLIFIVTSLVNCQKEDEAMPDQTFDFEAYQDSLLNAWDAIMIASANDIISNLNGQWAIDSVEIIFQDNYEHAQAGIQSDTVLTNLGQINFGTWGLLSAGSPDNTNYNNEAELIYESQTLPIRFSYLIHSPGESKVFSFIERVLEGNNGWNTTEGLFIQNVGIPDNIEIIKLNQNEYYFKGLNQGVKQMKLRRM